MIVAIIAGTAVIHTALQEVRSDPIRVSLPPSEPAKIIYMNQISSECPGPEVHVDSTGHTCDSDATKLLNPLYGDVMDDLRHVF